MRSASSSPIDPRRVWSRATRATGLLGGSVVGVAAAWAFAPLDRRILSTNPSGARTATANPVATPTVRGKIDVTAFDAVLWSKTPVLAPDAIGDVDRAKKPPADLHIDLIGITDEAGYLVAALYDRDRDRVLLVKDGDELMGGTRVKKLTLDEVVLNRGTEEIALARKRPER